jgi:hypothetical protein
MASTINATTSGVVTTGDSVATLSLQTGGTTAVAIDSAQIVSLSKSLALLGSTSGSVSIAAPATAGTQSYTLPTALPGTSGYALTSTTGGVMSWAAASATPAGSDTQVQYNSGGTAFAGSSNLTFNGTTLTAAGLAGPLNGTVGATTPSTGSFTTLAASSTVSGTGFSTYLASPPAIGGTAPAAGTFTTAKAIAASTQDAVQLQGRAGGTGSYVATITPTTLTASRTVTLPNADINFATGLPVANGGTGLTTGTSGGVPYFSGASAISSSAALTQYGIVYGGGAGGAPVATAAGTTGQFLGANTSGAPTWQTPTAGAGGSPTQVQYNNSGALAGISGFTSDGTRVTASTTIGVGGATPSTSGIGITFPSSESLSTNANTLDDYEEGTWIPTLGGTATYSSASGKYTKIGNSVFIQGIMTVSSIGTGSTSTISGLPYAGQAAQRLCLGGVAYWGNFAATTITVVPWIDNGTTTVQFVGNSSAASSVGNLSPFQNGTYIQFSGCYITNL